MDPRQPDAAWRGWSRATFVPWVVGLIAVTILGSMWLVSSTPGDTGQPAPEWVLWLLMFVGIAAISAALIVGRVEVLIGGAGITARFGSWGWPRREFPWAEVVDVTAIDVHPMEWGGWGYRWVPWRRGTAAVMRAGEGLRIDRVGGHVFVVTVDGAPEAAAAARPFLRRD